MSYVCRMQISQSYNLTIFAQDHFYLANCWPRVKTESGYFTIFALAKSRFVCRHRDA